MAAKTVKEDCISTVISGVTGHMGSELLKAIINRQDKFSLTGGLSRTDGAGLDLGLKMNFEFGVSSTTNLDTVKDADIVLDFSQPDFSLKTLDLTLGRKLPILIGTTGHSQNQTKKIEEASSFIPILFAPNTSIGIAFIKKILALSPDMLSVFKNKRISEKHHQNKKDSPSGTALDLSKQLKEQSNNEHNISIESKREGDSSGEHSIIIERKSYWSKAVETIEITHKAEDRSVFAEGALLAAEWLVNQKEGLYSMSDFYLP